MTNNDKTPTPSPAIVEAHQRLLQAIVTPPNMPRRPSHISK